MIPLLQGIVSNPSRYNLSKDEVEAIQSCVDKLKADSRRKNLGEAVDIGKTVVSIVKTLQEIFQEIPWP
jgi:hypothetical protein